ncbi:hypothetical protein [Salininema proteolyticum]|uniref:Uncharacterized protein n=1 Tax=Salininema proteolyticum TaxID=1607685 RepID=A0ABV8U4H8_9ACTN
MSDQIIWLAESNELGALREFYQPKQRSMMSRFNDAKLYLYTEGVIIDSSEDDLRVFTWEGLMAYRYHRSVNGKPTEAVTTFVEAGRPPVAVGVGVPLTQPRLNGQKTKRPDKAIPIVGEHWWGEEVQRQVTEVNLQKLALRAQQGGLLDFGGVLMDIRGIEVKGKRLSWTAVKDIGLHGGHLSVTGVQRRDVLLVDACDVANLQLALTLADHLSESAAPPGEATNGAVTRGREADEADRGKSNKQVTAAVMLILGLMGLCAGVTGEHAPDAVNFVGGALALTGLIWLMVLTQGNNE